MGDILDIFHSDPFTAIALTDAVQRNPYQPVGLENWIYLILTLSAQKPLQSKKGRDNLF